MTEFSAEAYRERREDARNPGRYLRELMSYVLIVLSVFLVTVFINDFVFSSVLVEGRSMEPNIRDGDVLFVSKLASPEIGDVIVVRAKPGVSPYIKRVYGLEGDTVWAEGGYVYRSYADASGARKTQKFEDEFIVWPDGAHEGQRQPTADFDPVTVGKGEVFFLGDNRYLSDDSRALGCRKLSDVVGVVTKFSIEHKAFFTKIFG